MSCPKTEHLVQEFFADDLAPVAREEIDRHLADCEACGAELRAILGAQNKMQQWHEQRVPHWDRGLELFRREHRVEHSRTGFWSRLQWLPTAASFAMLAVLLLNVTVVSNERSFSIAFGGADPGLNDQFAQLQESQRIELQNAIARFEDRQDSNNVMLMQAVMEQTQQTTAENFEQIYAYFEQQRLRDLQDMRASYQYLVDSDFETIRSLEQLASFVSYQGDLR